jgi:predicted AlkP superfamily phosphohydrolase/phosphomutase
MPRRLVVVGLDGVPPELLFEKLLPELPTVRHLVSRGLSGPMRSCDPPITVPAWAVMMTGRNPAELGVFGFRERNGASYTDISLVTSASIKAPAVWDHLGRSGRRSCLFGVPPGYPPKPIQGIMVGCHLTPDHTSRYTAPPDVQEELEANAGPYIPDVTFRSDNRDQVLEQLFEMTHQHAKLQRHLFKKERWDFFMGVEIGTDRIHHVFWKFSDPSHPKYTEHPRYSRAMTDYYRLIDQQLHELLSLLDDDTRLLLLSDHGAKAMQGCFCLNEWLIERGYLTLTERPARVMKLEQAAVDWSRTVAWGWGGYYARLFLNVKGREPQGCVAPEDVERIRTKLLQELEAVTTPDGRPLGITVINPALKGGVNPSGSQGASDLMLYFGDLSWRSAGTIGHGRLFLDENDTGPDDAVHSRHGIFLLYDPKRTWGTRLPAPRSSGSSGSARQAGLTNGFGLPDVAPTILRLLDLPIPSEMAGTPLEVG